MAPPNAPEGQRELYSPIEPFDVTAKYWRARLETRISQAQDLGAFARKVADDAVRPVQERIEKFAKAAA